MFKADDGKYYDDSGILLPLSEVPPDDSRKTPQGLKRERLKSKEEVELEYEYGKILTDGKPKNYNQPWDDKEIKEIIKEIDTFETRLEFAILLDRTPNAIEFIQAYAKRDNFDALQDIKDSLFLQVKRCLMEIGEIDQEEYNKILAKGEKEND